MNNGFICTYWCQGRWTLLLSSVPQGFLWKPKEAAACRHYDNETWPAAAEPDVTLKGNPSRSSLTCTLNKCTVPSQDFSSSILEYLQPHGGLSGCWEAPPVQPLFRHAPKPCRWGVMITWAAAQWLSFHASLPLLPFCPHFIVGCSTWYCLLSFFMIVVCWQNVMECANTLLASVKLSGSSSHAELMAKSVKIIIYSQLNRHFHKLHNPLRIQTKYFKTMLEL